MKVSVLDAMALEDTLAEAHGTLGNVRFVHDWDIESAEKAFRRAIQLNPNYADGLLPPRTSPAGLKSTFRSFPLDQTNVNEMPVLRFSDLIEAKCQSVFDRPDSYRYSEEPVKMTAQFRGQRGGAIRKDVHVLSHSRLVDIGVYSLRTIDDSIVTALKEFQYRILYAGKRQLLFHGELPERKCSFSKYHLMPSAIVALRG